MTTAGLTPQRLDVWFGDIERARSAVLTWAVSLLDDTERARLDSLTSDTKRREQALARGALRWVLGTVTGRPPGSLRFTTEGRGKPRLDDADESSQGPALQFNLSHSARILAIAVAYGPRVGIDVEIARERASWLKVARRYFSASEVRALENLPRERARQAFFTCWVRKEALVKATGGGIASGLAAFDVNVNPEQSPRLVASRDDDLDPGRWQLVNLDPGLGHYACLAVETAGPLQVITRGSPWPEEFASGWAQQPTAPPANRRPRASTPVTGC